MTEEMLTSAQLEEIGERVLGFQRYIFRRAWGAYYAAWAAAFVIFVFGGLLPLGNLVPQNLSWVPYAALYVGTGWVAGLASTLIFRSAGRTISLRRAVGSEWDMGGRRWGLIWVWWVAFAALAFVSFTFFQPQALTILYGLLASVEVFIYYSLRVSFGDQTPTEGRLALISYGACIVVSIFASLHPGGFTFAAVAWGGAAVVWVYCALSALWHAPEELVDLRL